MTSRKATRSVRRRGSAWCEEETKALLAIWEENSIEELLENPQSNNVSVYNTVATQLATNGFERTSDQCKVRIHTLKRSYRDCKSNLKKSGKGRRVCKYFEELDTIFGTRPASSPLKVIETLNQKAEDDQLDSSDSDDNTTEQTDTQTEAVVDNLSDVVPLVDDEPERDEKEDKDVPDVDSRENKRRESTGRETDKQKGEKKRVRKTRMEVALKSVMDGFTAANEKANDKVLGFERQKLELERQKLDFEKANLESEERQKREERQHQYNMMNMIMGAIRGAGQQPPPPVSLTRSRTAQYDGGAMFRSPGPLSHQSSSVSQQSSTGASWISDTEDGNYYNL